MKLYKVYMKTNRNLTQKQNKILFCICIISGITGILLLQFITLKNELLIKQCSMSQYLNYFYLNNHPRFDYMNGLYLIPFGILTICILILLEMDKIFLRIK